MSLSSINAWTEPKGGSVATCWNCGEDEHCFLKYGKWKEQIRYDDNMNKWEEKALVGRLVDVAEIANKVI